MKKLLSFILALTMVFAMATTAFAAEELNTESSKRIDAVGRLDSDGDGIPEGENEDPTQATVLAVDLEWDAMEFVYSTGKYDVDGMYYTSEWQDGSKNITVSNRSNVAISVSAAHAPAANNVNITLTNKAFDLAAAATAANTAANPGTPKKGTIKATVAADEDPISKDKESIGTITVTIARKA